LEFPLSRRDTLRDKDSTNIGPTRLPASSRMMLALTGSMRRKPPRNVTFARCAKDPEFNATGLAPRSTNDSVPHCLTEGGAETLYDKVSASGSFVTAGRILI
jgi:hypothetical protein